MTHELKVWPKYFKSLVTKEKKFEIRKNDRKFQIGDTLILKEWAPMGYNPVSPNEMVGRLTGDQITATISYILSDCPEFGLMGGYCILSISF